MTTAAILLVLLSALMHAGWNSIGKSSATHISFYLWATMTGVAIFSPILLWGGVKVFSLPFKFWCLLLASGVFQSIYLAGLAKAYREADLSLVYPFARSLPVLLVPLFVVIIFGATSVSKLQLGAMALIVMGACILPMSEWRSLSLKSYRTPAVGWALVAALGTAGYSLTDSAAIHIMKEQGWSALMAGGVFVVLQGFSIMLCLIPLIKWGFKESISLPKNRGALVLTGVFLVGTYLLVLMSMSMVDEVSYIVALRQLSIPLGVLIGYVWLKEEVNAIRLQGVSIMLVGLVLVSL